MSWAWITADPLKKQKGEADMRFRLIGINCFSLVFSCIRVSSSTRGRLLCTSHMPRALREVVFLYAFASSFLSWILFMIFPMPDAESGCKYRCTGPEIHEYDFTISAPVFPPVSRLSHYFSSKTGAVKNLRLFYELPFVLLFGGGGG